MLKILISIKHAFYAVFDNYWRFVFITACPVSIFVLYTLLFIANLYIYHWSINVEFCNFDKSGSVFIQNL